MANDGEMTRELFEAFMAIDDEPVLGDPVPQVGELVYFEFSVRIGVTVKDRSKLQLSVAKLRADEVLLGLPFADDKETWEHELISITDEDGTKIPEDSE